MPPDRLRHRLMRAAYIRSFRSKLRIRKHAAMQAISGALLILLIAGLFTLKGNDVQTQAAFEHTVSQRIADMQSEDTERYVIQPVEPFYGSGSVWLKRGSGEMLIVVNGLHSLQEKTIRYGCRMRSGCRAPALCWFRVRRERVIITDSARRTRSGSWSAWNPKGEPESDRARSRPGEYGALMP